MLIGACNPILPAPTLSPGSGTAGPTKDRRRTPLVGGPPVMRGGLSQGPRRTAQPQVVVGWPRQIRQVGAEALPKPVPRATAATTKSCRLFGHLLTRHVDASLPCSLLAPAPAPGKQKNRETFESRDTRTRTSRSHSLKNVKMPPVSYFPPVGEESTRTPNPTVFQASHAHSDKKALVSLGAHVPVCGLASPPHTTPGWRPRRQPVLPRRSCCRIGGPRPRAQCFFWQHTECP